MERFQKYGLTIEIERDEYPLNPREAIDHLATMACFLRKYNLGDKNTLSQEELEVMVRGKEYISLPLYLYDHSGLSMSTRDFGDRWDSSQVGYIFVSKEKIRKEYNVKNITKATLAKVYALLVDEVEEYDAFLQGEVYGYVIRGEDNEILDSCGGFICGNKEDREYLKEQTENSAFHYSQALVEKKAQQFSIEAELMIAE